MPYYNDSAIASILIKIQVAGFQYMPLQPPFTTNDGYIVDHLGQRLLFQSVNWYGASDADNNVVMGFIPFTVKNCYRCSASVVYLNPINK